MKFKRSKTGRIEDPLSGHNGVCAASKTRGAEVFISGRRKKATVEIMVFLSYYYYIFFFKNGGNKCLYRPRRTAQYTYRIYIYVCIGTRGGKTAFDWITNGRKSIRNSFLSSLFLVRPFDRHHHRDDFEEEFYSRTHTHTLLFPHFRLTRTNIIIHLPCNITCERAGCTASAAAAAGFRRKRRRSRPESQLMPSDGGDCLSGTRNNATTTIHIYIYIALNTTRPLSSSNPILVHTRFPRVFTGVANNIDCCPKHTFSPSSNDY